MADLLRTKRLVWGAILLLVTIVAGFVYAAGTRYLAAMVAVEQTLAVQSSIEGVLSQLKDAETGGRGFLLAADEQFLEPFHAARRGVPAHLSELERSVASDAPQRARLQRLRQLTDEKFAHVQNVIHLHRSGDTDRALLLVRRGDGKHLMDAMRRVCSAMRAHEQQRLLERRSEAERAQTTAAWALSLGSLLTIALAGLSFATVNRDVKVLRGTAEELAESEEHFRLLAENTSDLVRLLDPSGRATYVSPSVQRLLGYTPEEFLATPLEALVHPDELADTESILADVRAGRLGGGVTTYRLRNKDGEYRYFEVRWAVLRDDARRLVGLHTTGHDVTERRLAEELLTVQAQTLRTMSLRDELTGLFNRRGFLEVATHALAQARRDDRAAALLFVDLNGMKRINDELGHDTGDSALMDAAYVLSAALGHSDVLARLGGDEFVAFVRDFGAAELEPLRAKIRDLCDERAAELERPYRLSMSVGAAFAPVGDESTIEQLLERADMAMYEQKRARRAAGDVSLPPATISK